MPPSQYLVADGSSGDSFVYLYTSGLLDIYVELDIYICPDVITALDDGSLHFTAEFFQLYDLYGDGGQTPVTPPADFDLGTEEGLYVLAPGFAPPATWSTEANGNLAPPPVTSGAHNIQLHLLFASDTYEYIIDGTTYNLSGMGYLPGWMSQVDAVTFGSIFSPGGSFTTNNVTNVKVGTTGFGSSDIIADNFSGGISGAWSGTFGTCSVSASPSCGTPPPPGAAWVFQPVPGFRIAD